MLPSKPGNASARTAVKSQIDENLRRVYDEVLTEAIPDRFTQLLEQLKALDTAKADPAKPDPARSSAAPAKGGNTAPSLTDAPGPASEPEQ